MDGSIALPGDSDLLTKLVERVERGEEITLTRDGKPVARLVAAPKPRRAPTAEECEDTRRAAAELLELRKNTRLDGIDWRELRDEGRGRRWSTADARDRPPRSAR